MHRQQFICNLFFALLAAAGLASTALGFVASSGQALRSYAHSAAVAMTAPHSTRQLSTQLQAAAAPVTEEELAGKRLWLNFAAFGFANRTCQLTLEQNTNCTFSEGMISKEPGFWRIEEEDGEHYLQFTCPLTFLYSELFDVPSALLFWRGVLVRKPSQEQPEQSTVVVQDGLIISEKTSLWGLRTNFIREGNFTARALRDNEPFPSEGPVRILKNNPPGPNEKYSPTLESLLGTDVPDAAVAAAAKAPKRRRKAPAAANGAGSSPDDVEASGSISSSSNDRVGALDEVPEPSLTSEKSPVQ